MHPSIISRVKSILLKMSANPKVQAFFSFLNSKCCHDHMRRYGISRNYFNLIKILFTSGKSFRRYCQFPTWFTPPSPPALNLSLDGCITSSWPLLYLFTFTHLELPIGIKPWPSLYLPRRICGRSTSSDRLFQSYC